MSICAANIQNSHVRRFLKLWLPITMKNPASFHVPGHKSGQGLLDEGTSFLKTVMSIDYTEITGLDDLHHAEGVISEAEQLAADCFGAEETYFLIGGSTVGNLAMISAVCEKDDIILVQRNVHKSVIHGLMLAGAKAVFIAPSDSSGNRRCHKSIYRRC